MPFQPSLISVGNSKGIHWHSQVILANIGLGLKGALCGKAWSLPMREVSERGSTWAGSRSTGNIGLEG
jgi:hypothetical protein